MANRLKYTIDVQLSSSDAGTNDLGHPVAAVTSDALTLGGTRKVILAAKDADPALPVDVEIPLGVITAASFIAIFVSKRTRVKTRPDDLGLTIAPVGTATQGQFLLSTEGVTRLFVANLATDAACEAIIALGGT